MPVDGRVGGRDALSIIKGLPKTELFWGRGRTEPITCLLARETNKDRVTVLTKCGVGSQSGEASYACELEG